MNIKWFFLAILSLSTVPSTHSMADLTLLTNNELSELTAQYGEQPNRQGHTTTSSSQLDETRALESLYLTNKALADQAIYFSELSTPSNTDMDRLTAQVEQSLITYSTLLSSTASLTALLPILGLPIGLGLSASPNAFQVEVGGIDIQLNMNFSYQE